MRPAVAIYTDGGADPNPGPGGWGVVLLHPETGKTRELAGGEAATTNNRMELTAAIEALSSLKQPCAVELYTDSQYLRRGITEWLPGWRRKGWKKSDGTPVVNADLWQRLATAAARHEINWHWVKGHAGHQHNERADELATAAMRALPGVEKPRPSFDVEVFLKVSGGNPGAWAALVRRGEDEQVASATGLAATSNLLDVLAAAETLEKIPPGPSIAVYTVSDYLRNGATQWLAGWRQRRWKTATGEAVKNAAAWRRLDAALGRRKVAWPALKGELSPELKQLEKVLKEAQKR